MPIPNKERIRRLRKEIGLSQRELARQSGVAYRLIQGAEAGEEVTVNTLQQLAFMFGKINYEELMIPEGAVISVSMTMPPQDTSDPHLVSMFFQYFQKTMEGYQLYREQYNKSGSSVYLMTQEELVSHFQDLGFSDIRIVVYFVPGENKYGHKTYLYALNVVERHKEFLQLINETGQIVDEALVVAIGVEQPSNDVKRVMKEWYGFDHNELAADPSKNWPAIS